jgi:hypothetical protein
MQQNETYIAVGTLRKCFKTGLFDEPLEKLTAFLNVTL